MNKCKNPACLNELNKYGGNNGLPLFEGNVCDSCNLLVLAARIK